MSAEEDGAAERLAIGITFGNSYSSIACTQGGDAKVIANEEGDRQIPSILSYVDGEEFHGAQAKAQLVRNSDNTVGGFRDYIGKRYVIMSGDSRDDTYIFTALIRLIPLPPIVPRNHKPTNLRSPSPSMISPHRKQKLPPRSL